MSVEEQEVQTAEEQPIINIGEDGNIYSESKSTTEEPTDEIESEESASLEDNKEEVDQPEDSTESESEEEELTSESETEDSTATTDEEDEEDDETFYNELSEQTGLELKSEEDITQALKELAQMRKSNPLDEDKELKAFYEFKKSGGDTAQFHALRSKNFESMDDKSLLKEKYLLDHKDLAKDKPSLAESRFQREMKSKYSLLDVNLDAMDEEDRAEWMEENGEELKIQQEEFQYESEQAKNSLLKWQEESTSPVQQESKEISPEDAQKIQQKWNESISNSAKSFNGIEVKVGEGIEDFKVGLTPDESKAIESQIQDPGKFIAELTGFNAETGEVDANKLYELAAKLQKLPDLGAMLSDYVLENRNRETIEAEATNPSNPDRSGKGQKNLSFAERAKHAKHVSNFN